MPTEVSKVMNRFGRRVTKLAKINLGAEKKDTSGKLRKTLKYTFKESKNSFEFAILAEDYWYYVDQGRKAGKGTPWTKAKGFYVIKDWIKRKPVRLRDFNKGVSPAGRKFVKKKDSAINSAAFLINRKIKREGIKPTYFLTEPFEKEFKKLPDDLIEAYGLDIEELLEDSINNLGT